ncbi:MULTISPECIES: alkyl hydroperoxide reductase subunit F [unclassified Lentimicrobium]|uniref:alkyl hydroperoxide reductase subunit F n=1 Tax=unclassified Lentimicrobium TaxID=2677434 RepID=UPI00155477D5|nr:MULTISPECIES: alkyl hydroperoxide reductase subunit F [unclassified Lentimicrobium]NPD44104.1 alkyl hydroperoxide reductase subunit F [Lentimicrobium sp. S6]NPD86227.1 alkyl hydroperoxide reductase subunit F [Lentimicrobium sp. L6]
MLDQNIKQQVTGIFAELKNEYTFKIQASENHSKRDELTALLKDVASCSSKIKVETETQEGFSFEILKNSEPTNIVFKAIPTGHEFSSLLAAILNLDGIGKNLPDETLSQRIKNLKGKIEIKSYISLTCTNCPEVVKALNVISILNPNVRHEIIDGALYQKEIEKLNIQAVPTVYANGEVLHIGRSSLGELIDKLEKLVGSEFLASTETKEYDVVIAGGGPAGAAAAIYSARKGFSVAVVAEKVGGQVAETVGIENLISVPKTTGKELTANLMKHLQDYPIDIFENRRIESTEIIDGKKYLHTSLGEKFAAPALIIATGASWRKLGVPGENEYLGSGVAFCTHCDGPFYKDKKVVVVGGGNSGLEAAIDLSSIATHVTVLEFLEDLKGDQILQDKLNEMPNVDIITNAASQSIDGDGQKVSALQYQDRTTKEVKTIDTDGVFVQIGLKSNSDVFKNIVDTNRFGEIEIDAHCRTSQAGVFAAGDVSIVPYKQIVIAMGEGSKAALSAFEDKIKNRLG